MENTDNKNGIKQRNRIEPSAMKIDVCVCTKNGKLPRGLNHIPINNLIVEDSKPIGIARMNAIKKVETEIFAFIDDDVIISESWLAGLPPFMDREEVGAAWGTIRNEGLGIFDRSYAAIVPYGELKKGDRFNTNNSLIKTRLVKDWKPTIGLNCYEDLDLGFHMMAKGYKILNVPSDTIHKKGFLQLAKSAYWAGSTYREAYRPTNLKLIRQYLGRFAYPFFQIFTHGILSAVIVAYRNLFFVAGMLKIDVYDRFKQDKN